MVRTTYFAHIEKKKNIAERGGKARVRKEGGGFKLLCVLSAFAPIKITPTTHFLPARRERRQA